MASTFTTGLRFEMQATGENRSSWGTKTNTNLGLVEEAISGLKTIAMTDANLTLSKVNAATDQSRPMFLRFTGTLTANRTITIPTVSKMYFMQNATAGSKNLIITAGAVAGGEVPIAPGDVSYPLPPGQWKLIYTDGSTLWSSDGLFSASSGTRRWDIVAAVDAAGVTEVGKDLDFHNSNTDVADYSVRLGTGGTTTDMYITPSTGSLTSKKIWHAGNDGTASGMDADMVDGKHASEIFSEPPNDGKFYARRTVGGVSSWVAFEAPWTTDPSGTGAGDVILDFGAGIKVRIRTDGFIRTASDVQIYSTTVVAGG